MPTEFSWSISRHEAFATCRRKYFYAYHAAAEDPEVQRLKRLSALPLWAGSVVHEVIEELLKTRGSVPPETEQEAMIRAAVHGRMLSEWRESEGGSLRFRLFEHEYAVPVDTEDKKILVGTVMRSLRNFFRSETLREAYDVGRDCWLSVEDLLRFDIGGVPIQLRMDLAFRDRGGRVVIVDWKTGRSEGRFSQVQVAAYALCASLQGWAKEADEIRTELAYLAVPRYIRRGASRQTLDRVRRFIERSARNMKSLLFDPVANVARIEDFPMIDRPQTCRRCNFRRLCFPRMKDDDALPASVSA